MNNDYKYRLIEFKDIRNNVKSVDIVSKEWIMWNVKKDASLCYFMLWPYNKEKLTKLRNFVKNCLLPNYSWPKYILQSCGKASKLKKVLIFTHT